jgi:molybdopterin-guanine dinucleotide biosynthesis protein A
VSRRPLGAIIAGGASSRFGAPKALALLDGERIIDRVARSLAAATSATIMIANDDAIAGALPFESRPDVVTGIGALAGVCTALLWAKERSIEWIIAVACDMPFVEPALIDLLAKRCNDVASDVVAPASGGPRGIEPLCAAYRTTCIDSIRASIQRGDPRMIGFHRDVRVDTIPLDEVSAIGDPALLFMNVNTPADLERATAIIELGRTGA